jgi:hypothetical protein
MRLEKLLPRAVLDEISPLGEGAVSLFWRSVGCISFSSTGNGGAMLGSSSTVASFGLRAVSGGGAELPATK